MGNLQCNCYDNRNQTELYSSIETYFTPPSRDIHAPARNFFIGLDREFAKKYALKDLLAAYPNRRLSSEIIQMIWIHYFTYDESSTVEQSRLEHDTKGTTPRTHKSFRSSLSQYPLYINSHDSPHSSQSYDIPSLPPLLSTSHSSSSSITDLDRMIYLITDVLRYDLLVLKDHFEGLKRQYKRDGLSLNLQDPALVKIKSDVLKLNHMPIDYIAKLILKEMHEPEVEAQFAAASNPNNNDIDTSDPNQVSSPSFNPMRSSSPSFNRPSSPPLTLSLFQSRFDRCMRICLDKYYRRGFWLLFCLNVMDHYYHLISRQQQQQQQQQHQQQHISHLSSQQQQAQHYVSSSPPQQSQPISSRQHTNHESISHSHNPPKQPLFIPTSQSDARPLRPSRRRRMTYSHSHTYPNHGIQPDLIPHQPSRSRSVRPILSQSQSVTCDVSQSHTSHPLQRPYHNTSSTSTRVSRHASLSRISVPSITPSLNGTPSTTPFQTPTASLVRADIPPLPLTHVSHEFPKQYHEDILKSQHDDMMRSKHDDTSKHMDHTLPTKHDGSLPLSMEKTNIHSLQLMNPTTHAKEYVHSPA